jgi:hypothetical protein
LFELKRKLDPEFRFRNVLWDKYYAPTLGPSATAPAPKSEFHAVFSDVKAHDAFYRFLQNIFRLHPEDRFHTLIKEACATDLLSFRRHAIQRLLMWRPSRQPPSRSRQRPREPSPAFMVFEN